MSNNPNITWEVVRANPGKRWDFFRLRQNRHITWNNVVPKTYKRWHWIGLSKNLSITYDDVAAYPGKQWSWTFLSSNPRMLITKADEARIGKTRLLITRFQRRWRACITDPSHPFCQRRLLREWHAFECI